MLQNTQFVIMAVNCARHSVIKHKKDKDYGTSNRTRTRTRTRLYAQGEVLVTCYWIPFSFSVRMQTTKARLLETEVHYWQGTADSLENNKSSYLLLDSISFSVRMQTSKARLLETEVHYWQGTADSLENNELCILE